MSVEGENLVYSLSSSSVNKAQTVFCSAKDITKSALKLRQTFEGKKKTFSEMECVTAVHFYSVANLVITRP